MNEADKDSLTVFFFVFGFVFFVIGLGTGLMIGYV